MPWVDGAPLLMFEKSLCSLVLLRFSWEDGLVMGVYLLVRERFFALTDIWRQGVAFVQMLFCWYDTLECFC
jgi:hypothetical protein